MPARNTYLRARNASLNPHTRRAPLVALTKEDRTALRDHLRDCELSVLWNDRLLARLLRSRIVLAACLTQNDRAEFATGGCWLIYRLDGGNPESGRLVHHLRGSKQDNEIGVASILGATLIGLRKGQKVGLVTGGDVELLDIPPMRELSPDTTDKPTGVAPAAGRIAILRRK